MKQFLIIIVIFLFSSCSLIEEPIINIDNRLDKYIELYQYECDVRGIDWNPENIVFKVQIIENLTTKGGEQVSGLTIYKKKETLIQIDKNQYDRYVNSEREYIVEYIMIHEFLHAFHKLDHSKDRMNIMNYQVKGNYKNNREEMLNTTFKELR